MAREVEKLTAVSVRNQSEPGLHPDGNGLYLHVGPSRSKSWILRYRFAGKRHDIGLGAYPLFSLADARDRANAKHRLIADGTNPKDEGVTARRRAAIVERAVTAATSKIFEDCADEYIGAQEAGWKDPREAPQWRQSLRTHAYPIIGKLPVAAVDTPLVLSVLKPIWTTKSETASRVRRRIEKVLGWATTSGYRQGDNPARWGGHLENLLPKKSRVAKVEHHDKLDYREVGTFMAELRGMDRLGAKALEYAILTAARLGEVVNATWLEVDLKGRVWTVPGARMKGGKEHRVPLSDPALALLEALPRTGERIFPVSKTIVWHVAKGLRQDTTVHGFRGTFRDWAGDLSHAPQEVIEQCLAHRIGDATEQSYYTSDALEKRRRVMEAWAGYCAKPAPDGANVVPIGKGKAA